MTDEQVEKIIRSNMMLQMNLAGIRADFEEALQRTWVGLTAEEKSGQRPFGNGLLFNSAEAQVWEIAVDYAEAKLKEKNNG
jgi:hypothetical protein